MQLLVASVLLLSGLSVTDGRSRGAPCSILSEKNLEMAPQHGARPRTSPSPYIIIVTREGRDANETLQAKTYYKITIDFDPHQNTLAGFVIRAVYDRNPGLLPKDAGKWIVPGSSCAREIKCGEGTFITHKRPRRCTVHSFVWLSPDKVGEYVYFQASGVLDYNTFWTNIRTRSYRLISGPTTTTTTTTPKPTSPTTTKATTKPKTTTVRTTRTTTTATFPPTTTLKPLTTPPYDPACEPDGPDCLTQLRRDTSRKFCEIGGWQDYCPQLCCYKVKGEEKPDFSRA